METRWVARLLRDVVGLLVMQVAKRPTAACYVFAHEFRGAAVHGPSGHCLRQQHVLLEIVTQYDGSVSDGSAERAWAIETSHLLARLALPGAMRTCLEAMIREAASPSARMPASCQSEAPL